MMESYTGELAAIVTAVFWTATAIAFEIASKKIGSLSLNLIRLVMAFFLLGVFNWVLRGSFFSIDAGHHQWVWLPVSGIIGFVLGDYFLFRAYMVIGSRISMLIMALVPPITALIGFFLMGEVLTLFEWTGMALVITGIVIVILSRDRKGEGQGKKKLSFNFAPRGLLFAVGGAVGQAVGLVFSKYGMQEYDAFAASHIRVLAGVVGYLLLFTFLNRWNKLAEAFRNRSAMVSSGVGAFFGPFLGVSFSLLAVKFTATGVASTIMAIVPVLIILPSVLIFKEKIKIREVVGAALSVLGVAMMFM